MPQHLEKYYNRIESIRARNPQVADALEEHGYRSVRQMCVANNLDCTHVGDLLNGRRDAYGKTGFACLDAREIAEALDIFPEQLTTLFTFESWSRKRDHRRSEGDYITVKDAEKHLRWCLDVAARTVLTDRERLVINYRYGFKEPRPWGYTHAEIGSLLGITKDRVRQIELRALRRMHGLHLKTGLFNECGSYIPQHSKSYQVLDFWEPSTTSMVRLPRKKRKYTKRKTPTIWQQMKRAAKVKPEPPAEQPVEHAPISAHPQSYVIPVTPTPYRSPALEPSPQGIINRMRPEDPRVMRVHNEFLKFQAEHSRRMRVIEDALDRQMASLGLRDNLFRTAMLERFGKLITAQMEREILSRESV